MLVIVTWNFQKDQNYRWEVLQRQDSQAITWTIMSRWCGEVRQNVVFRAGGRVRVTERVRAGGLRGKTEGGGGALVGERHGLHSVGLRDTDCTPNTGGGENAERREQRMIKHKKRATTLFNCGILFCYEKFRQKKIKCLKMLFEILFIFTQE